MLDIKFIRENPEKVKQGCQKKQVEIDIDTLLALDKRRREMLQEIESLRAEQNRISKQKIEGEIREKAKELKEKIRALEEEFKGIDKEFKELTQQIPNLPLDDVPAGRDEIDNVVIKKVGKIPRFNFKPKDHLEIGQSLDIIDIERAAKVAGARFAYLKKEAALIEFSLVNFAFSFLIKKGFTPIIPPVMMKKNMMRGMGYIEQTNSEEAYYLPKDDLFLVGTAEQPIGAMHAGEIFEEKDLSQRYVGFST